MSVPENICIAAETYGLPRDEAMQLVEDPADTWTRAWGGRTLTLVVDGQVIEGTWTKVYDEQVLFVNLGTGADAGIAADRALARAHYGAGSDTEMTRRAEKLLYDGLRTEGIIQ